MSNDNEEKIESLWGSLDFLDEEEDEDWEEMEDDEFDEDEFDEDGESFDKDLLQKVVETHRRREKEVGEVERKEELKSKGIDSIIFDPKDLYLPD